MRNFFIVASISLLGFILLSGQAFAQGKRFERRPPQTPTSATVGNGAGTVKTIEAALRAVDSTGEIFINPKTNGSKLHHFEETIDVNKHLSIVGNGAKKVAITTNNQCIVVRDGVELKLKNLRIVAQGLGEEPCIVIKNGTVTLENVDILMGYDRNGAAVDVKTGSRLAAPTAESPLAKGTSQSTTSYVNIIQREPKASAVHEGVVVRKDARLDLQQKTEITGFTTGLKLYGSARIEDVTLEGSKSAVSLYDDAKFEAIESKLSSAYSNAIEANDATIVFLESVDVNGKILFPAGSSAKFSAVDQTTFAGSIIAEDGDVSADILLQQSTLTGKDWPVGAGFQADNGIELNRGFSGTLRINEMLISRAHYGIDIRAASKENSIFIQELSFNDIQNAGVRIHSDISPQAVRKIEITSHEGTQIDRPVVSPKNGALCQSADALNDRIFVRWMRKKLNRKVCKKAKNF